MPPLPVRSLAQLPTASSLQGHLFAWCCTDALDCSSCPRVRPTHGNFILQQTAGRHRYRAAAQLHQPNMHPVLLHDKLVDVLSATWVGCVL